MPLIPTMSLPGTAVNIQDVYEGGLYNPAPATPDTLEILNGGLDSANQAVAADYVPTWAIQPGALVSGVYLPFERWEYIYGPQISGNTTDTSEARNLAVPVAGLCARVFKPWDANFIIMGYQAFFQHDARAVSTSTDPTEENLEEWRVFVTADVTLINGLTAILPYGAYQNPDEEDDQATYMNENRWRFVSKVHGFKRGVASANIMDKGYLTLRVSLWASLREKDKWKCKCKIPTGGLWIMAFR